MTRIREALQGLRNARTLAVSVILAIGVGAGPIVALFGAVDRILFADPPGVREPDGIVRIYGVERLPSGERSFFADFSYPHVRALRRSGPNPAQLVAFQHVEQSIGENGDRRRVEYVGPGYFSVLGVRPMLGRFFDSGEDLERGGSRVAVISHRLWTTLFGADAGALYRPLRVDSLNFTIVGVAEQQFVGIDAEPADVFVPIGARPPGSEGAGLDDPTARAFEVFARIGSGAKQQFVDQLMAGSEELRVASIHGLVAAPLLRARGPLGYGDRRDWNLALLERLGVVAGAILLVSAASAGSLQLMRVVRRRRDNAIRLALGVTPQRLAEEVALECALLAAAGAFVALLLGWWAGAFLQRTILSQWHGIEASAIRSGVLAAAIATVIGVLVAAAPTAFTLRRAWQMDLRNAETPTTGVGVRRALLGGLAALSVLLLAVSGVFLQSLRRAIAVDSGFAIENTFSVNLAGRAVHPDIVARLVDGVSRLPGVHSIGTASSDIPPGSQQGTFEIPSLGLVEQLLSFNAVDSSYLTTLGVRVIEGRTLGSDDKLGADPVVVVSRSLADRFWPGQSALGQCVVLSRDNVSCRRVVGVTADIRWNVAEPTRPLLYLPLGQMPRPRANALVVRLNPSASAETIGAIAAILQREVPEGRTNVRLLSVESRIAPLIRPWRVAAALFVSCGIVALMAAVLGMTALAGYHIAERRRELAIRRALGASTVRIAMNVLAGSVASVAVGALCGLLFAALAGNFLREFLFGTSPFDATALVAAVGTVLVAAAIATVRPLQALFSSDVGSALRSD